MKKPQPIFEADGITLYHGDARQKACGGCRGTGTAMLFWDGKDEVPSLGNTLPTYWFGPLPNPPF